MIATADWGGDAKQSTVTFTVTTEPQATDGEVVVGQIEFHERPKEPPDPPTEWRDLDLERDWEGSPEPCNQVRQFSVTPRARSPPSPPSFFCVLGPTA